MRQEYLDERRLRSRREVYSGGLPSALELVLELIAEIAPATILEAGCGEGEIGKRACAALDAQVIGLDLSPRMAWLAHDGGLVVVQADVEALPFSDRSFECAVAAWMLYHAADVDSALSELARVVRPGGRLVAATNGAQHLIELRDLVGAGPARLCFSRENGETALRKHLGSVARHDIDGVVMFRNSAAVRYIESSIILVPLLVRLGKVTAPFKDSPGGIRVRRRRAASLIATRPAARAPRQKEQKRTEDN